MNSQNLHPIIITIGLFGFAGLLLWKGDTAHALMCVVLAVPNAQQIFSAATKAPPSPPPPAA